MQAKTHGIPAGMGFQRVLSLACTSTVAQPSCVRYLLLQLVDVLAAATQSR